SCHPSLLSLLSFPTRRSSDLAYPSSHLPCPALCALPFSSVVVSLPLEWGGWIRRTVRSIRLRSCRWEPKPPSKAFCPTRWQPRRSEEHTSELQSRENLVCRLL